MIAPSHVKPATSASYTVALTSDSSSPEGADRAKIGIPSGFSVGASSVQATAGAAGVCQASTWVADGELLADGKINLKRPELSPSDELCPGATLTVVFTATSGGAEGSAVWASELLRGLAPFVLAGSQPVVQVDGTLPQVSITSAPSTPTNLDSASFVFSSDEAATFECKLDDGAFGPCASPKDYSALADGSHTFFVEATDTAGNSAESSHTWTIDTTLPTTTITETPSDPNNESSQSFGFTTSELADAECNLDRHGLRAMHFSQDLLGARGRAAHVRRPRDDPAGNTGTQRHVRLGDRHVGTDGRDHRQAAEPEQQRLAELLLHGEPGRQHFRLQARQRGVRSVRFAEELRRACGRLAYVRRQGDRPCWQYECGDELHVDDRHHTADDHDLRRAGVLSNSASATFEFAAVGTATFECKLDAGAYGPCASPKAYTSLDQGSHTFEVRATDLAGNVGPEASRTWRVDTVAPTTTIDGTRRLTRARRTLATFDVHGQ